MRVTLVLAAAVAVTSACAKTAQQPPTALQAKPPQIRPEDGPPIAQVKPHVVDSPHGGRQDPYYWLRDDARTNPEVLDYLKAENAFRDHVLVKNAMMETELFKELTDRLVQTDTSVPRLDRGYLYYQRLEQGKERAIWCRKKGTVDAPEEILIDANAAAEGKEFYRIGGGSVSDSGLFAFADDSVGRRQFDLHIKNLTTGEMLPDTVANIDPDIAWVNDTTLLYIEKDPETLLGVRVRKHVLGAKSDPVVYEEHDHSFYMGVSRSKSNAYIFIELKSTTTSEVLYASVKDKALKLRPVMPRQKDHEYEVEHVGSEFIIRTNSAGATNFRVVRVPVGKSAKLSAWKDFIPHRKDVFIGDLDVTADAVAVEIREGGLNKIFIKPFDDKVRYVTLTGDEPSYDMSLTHTLELKALVRYEVESLVTPTITYDFDIKAGQRKELKAQQIPGYDPAQYATEFLQATARDGTQVPVTVAYRKDTPRDGSAPLYQYGYGAYGESTDPEFDSDWVSLMNRGFVVAIAHVRGGQELGRSWYESGKLQNKKNTFTDFIDVTHGLVEHGYGARGKVVAEGGSAGGLLMGAIANMSPSDYRAICAFVPFVDVVTTMLDESIPLTSNEYDEWGNPNDASAYEYMLSYSPYDNVSAQAYPAMLVFTGLWDSQVQYFEPTKWVAKLRATKTDNHLLVLSVDMASGHGGKSGRYERKRDRAREYAFFLSQLSR
jgi:oligopeptidase B